MQDNDNIFLVGPMGAGKSSTGKKLAEKLNRTFYDSDHEIEARTGVKIALIFDIESEQGFRKRESRMIEELSNHSNVVLATGGGAVLDPQNRKYLMQRGFVVYLKASLEQLLKRTDKDKKRPLLQTQDPKTQLEKLLTEREPNYQEVADLIIETDRRTVNSVVEEICKQKELIGH